MLYLFESVVVDADRRRLQRGGTDVHLPPKAFALLLFLIEQRPNAVTKADLMAHIWPDTFVSDATLASLVADVRVSQLVNEHKGIHVMMPKSALQKAL